MGLIRQCISAILDSFRRLFSSAIEVVWLVICYMYIAWWTISSFGRRLLTESAIIIVLLASGMVFLELAGAFFGKHVEVIHLPLWGEALVLLLGFGLVYHRYNEFRQFRRESVFATTVANLFEEIALLHFVPGKVENNQQVLEGFVRKILAAFRIVYRSKRPPQLNVMLKDADGMLRIHFAEPMNAEYEPGISFATGDGGAGIAFEKGVTIYVPAIKYRHGIGVVDEKYELLATIYRHVKVEHFKSVICTPVKSGSTTFGVLNVDSKRQNAFNMTDVQIARVAASAVGMAIDRHNTSS
jgi:hypothetical protein